MSQPTFFSQDSNLDLLFHLRKSQSMSQQIHSFSFLKPPRLTEVVFASFMFPSLSFTFLGMSLRNSFAKTENSMVTSPDFMQLKRAWRIVLFEEFAGSSILGSSPENETRTG